MSKLSRPVLYSIVIIASSIITSIVIMEYETKPTPIAKPTLVSKQQAIKTALQVPLPCQHLHFDQYSNYTLNETSINGQLFHIKNQTAYFVDDETMKDMTSAGHYLAEQVGSSDYVWEIAWVCYFPEYGEPPQHFDTEPKIHFVDAKSGVLLN